jgi:hypothetical protein
MKTSNLTWLITVWLHKKTRDGTEKKVFTLYTNIFPHPLNLAHYTHHFGVLTYFTNARQNLLVLLQATRPQLLWSPQCPKTAFP